MNHPLCISVIILLTVVQLSVAQDTTNTNLTKVGQIAPQFTVTTLDGQEINIEHLKEKIALINFFATWCDLCMTEMPLLEKEIWQKFKDKDFIVIAIGREHSKEELIEFKQKSKLSFLMAPDPNREVYQEFATMYIPRNYLIDREGRIVYQSRGYTDEEFKTLVNKIEEFLK